MTFGSEESFLKPIVQAHSASGSIADFGTGGFIFSFPSLIILLRPSPDGFGLFFRRRVL
jgi:hypothetical protein